MLTLGATHYWQSTEIGLYEDERVGAIVAYSLERVTQLTLFHKESGMLVELYFHLNDSLSHALASTLINSFSPFENWSENTDTNSLFERAGLAEFEEVESPNNQLIETAEQLCLRQTIDEVKRRRMERAKNNKDASLYPTD